MPDVVGLHHIKNLDLELRSEPDLLSIRERPPKPTKQVLEGASGVDNSMPKLNSIYQIISINKISKLK